MAPLRYKAYGLIFDSEIPPLTPVASVTGTPDVVIRYGPVPGQLSQTTFTNTYYDINQHQFLLHTADFPRLLVEDGNRIHVGLREGPPSSVAELVHGLGAALILHQRDQIILHASAITTQNGAVLFVGHTKTGKSSLASLFAKHGFSLITDDITCLTRQGDNWWVQPAFAYTKVKPEIVEQLKLGPDRLDEATLQDDKRLFMPQHPTLTEPVPLHCAFFLYSSDVTVSIRALKGHQKIMSVTNHIYRKRLRYAMGIKQDYNIQLIHLVQHSDLYAFHRVLQTTNTQQSFDLIMDAFNFRPYHPLRISNDC